MGVALRAKNCYNTRTVCDVFSMYVFAPERQGKISGREVFETGTKFGEGCSCVLHEVVKAFVPVEIIMSWLVAKIRFKV